MNVVDMPSISLYDGFVGIVMSIFSSYKKIFLLGFIIVILIAIPFSVYIAQKRQNISSKADTSTTLSFDPESPTVKVGEILTLDIVLDPKTGITGSRPNQVSFVKLSISFNPEKFTTVADSLKPNTASPNTLTSILEDPVYGLGKASISLSIGADPTKVVTVKTKIAILQLKALSATDTSNPKTSVAFGPDTQVLSIASSDPTSENVLSTTIPATVTINNALSSSISPSTTPTVISVSPTTSPSAAPIQGGGAGQIPISAPSSSSAIIILSPTPIPIPTFVPIGTKGGLPPTGPTEIIFGLGVLGAIFTIIGGALLIFL